MRTRQAIDAQLHLAVHKARRMPMWHPDYADLHHDIDLLLTERDQVGGHAAAQPRAGWGAMMVGMGNGHWFTDQPPTDEQVERGRAYCRAQAGKPYNGWTDEDRALLAYFGATEYGLIACALVKSGNMSNPLDAD